MPIFIEERPQGRGKTGFLYDISGEDPAQIAAEIISVADAPFLFQGRLGDRREPLEQPQYVTSTLARGGMVAGSVPFSGMSVTVFFVDSDHLMVNPPDGDKMTADALIGASDFGDYDDFDDDFGGDQFEDDPYGDSGYGAMDPRAGSMGGHPGGHDGIDNYAVPGSASRMNQGGEGVPVMSIKDWFITLIPLLIPIVNIVVLVLWLISKKTNPNKKNFLIVETIVTVASTAILGALGFLLFSSGLLTSLLFAGMMPTATTDDYYSNGNANWVLNNTNATNENEDDLFGNSSNANGNANENNENSSLNLNSNLNGNRNSTSNVSTSVTEQTLPVTLDNFARSVSPDGRPVAIMTMTYNNETDAEQVPSAIFNVFANQGQNGLEMNFMEQDGFVPATFDAPVPAHTTGIFQVSFILVDDQSVDLRVLDKVTQNVLLTVNNPL